MPGRHLNHAIFYLERQFGLEETPTSGESHYLTTLEIDDQTPIIAKVSEDVNQFLEGVFIKGKKPSAQRRWSIRFSGR